MTDTIEWCLYQPLSRETLDAFTEHFPIDSRPNNVRDETDASGKIILISFLIQLNDEIISHNDHVLKFNSTETSSSGVYFGFIIRIHTQAACIAMYPYPGSPLAEKKETFTVSKKLPTGGGWNVFFVTRIVPKNLHYKIYTTPDKKDSNKTIVIVDFSEKRTNEVKN